MARTYRALGALLSYPTEALAGGHATKSPRCWRRRASLPHRNAAISALLDEIAAARTSTTCRSATSPCSIAAATLSLHLFEHVHGESRDRGQAMADLIALYESMGWKWRAGELPDFLPLFLEFLSLLPDAEARAMLAEPAGILRALADRLAARDTGYAAVMAGTRRHRRGAAAGDVGHPRRRPRRPRGAWTPPGKRRPFVSAPAKRDATAVRAPTALTRTHECGCRAPARSRAA